MIYIAETKNIDSRLYLHISNKIYDLSQIIINDSESILSPSGKYIKQQACIFSLEYHPEKIKLSKESFNQIKSTMNVIDIVSNNVPSVLNGNIKLPQLISTEWFGMMCEHPMIEFSIMLKEYLLKSGLLDGKIVELGAGVGSFSFCYIYHIYPIKFS